MPNQRVPILLYHQVSPHPWATFAKYTVTTRAFAAQMRWLRLIGYHTITLDTWLDWRMGKGQMPRRPVIITFDDGFQEGIEQAVPILQANGFTAIFYLVAGLMGNHSEWLGAAFPLANWATARRLASDGFQLGAHTMRHPQLATITAAECTAELAESQQQIADQLGQPVDHLAYPHGSYNAQVRAIAADIGYRTAGTTDVGFADASADPLLLPRVPVTGRDSLVDFICRLQRAGAFWELMQGKVRGGGDGWRYPEAT